MAMKIPAVWVPDIVSIHPKKRGLSTIVLELPGPGGDSKLISPTLFHK